MQTLRGDDDPSMETPFFGVRQTIPHLRYDGHLVNEKRIRRLMRIMGLMPIYQKPNTKFCVEALNEAIRKFGLPEIHVPCMDGRLARLLSRHIASQCPAGQRMDERPVPRQHLH